MGNEKFALNINWVVLVNYNLTNMQYIQNINIEYSVTLSIETPYKLEMFMNI